MDNELKAILRAKKAELKANEELQRIYEQGHQAALNGLSVDDMPKYRKQNKAANWLKGFADGKQEQEMRGLHRNAKSKEGIERIKAIAAEILKN